MLYALIAVSKLGITGYERASAVITLTVLLSVFLHGLSAVPLTACYSRYLDRQGLVHDEDSSM